MKGEAIALFFESLVSNYVEEDPRFVRRDWLARKLEERIRGTGKSFVLLMAEHGAGRAPF